MLNCCRGTETVSLTKTLKSVCKNVLQSFGSDVKANRGTIDPEEVREGDVFFAHSNGDLEEEIGLAIYRGCAAVVAEQPANGTETVPFFVLPNVKDGYAAFCHAVSDYPARSLKMVGITGTSGKTSTSYLVSGMFAEAGFQVGLIGSLGVFDGEMLHSDIDGDLSCEQLAFYLNKMVMNGCTHAVVEASCKMLATGALTGIQFDAVILTNIRRDHLDEHQTVEQYRRTKLGIFKHTKKKALVICNADDRITEAVVPLINHPMLTVGIHRPAELGATVIERHPNEQTFLLNAGTESVSFCTKIIGNEHVYNCLSAAALGMGFGIDFRTIARGIERIESVPGRMERIECGQNFNVFIDSARTPDSLVSVLKAAKEITAGRLFCVFGATDTLDKAKRAALGTSMEMLSDCVILTSANDYLDAAAGDAVCDIGEGFTQRNNINVMPNRAEAIALALSEAAEGDTVMIFGKGKTQHNDGEAQYSFCDRHFARQWLYENQECCV